MNYLHDPLTLPEFHCAYKELKRIDRDVIGMNEEEFHCAYKELKRVRGSGRKSRGTLFHCAYKELKQDPSHLDSGWKPHFIAPIRN